MKIVLNRCFGGFNISYDCAKYMADKGHKGAKQEIIDSVKEGSSRWYGYFINSNKDRTDPLLIEAIENLKEKANGKCAKLEIIEIDDNIGDDWYIDDYDGMESVHENHRSW